LIIGVHISIRDKRGIMDQAYFATVKLSEELLESDIESQKS
jgi:hypothetical protein